MNRRALLLGFAGVGLTSAAMAQQLPGFGDGIAGGLGDGFGGGQDAFRAAALMDGSYAIQTSQIALERSRNSKVRSFAQLEIEEQTAVAAALGVTPTPLPLRSDQADVVAQLRDASGRSFDALYVQGQMAGHQELLGLNSRYAQGGGNPTERRVAVLAVPSIRTHLAILHGLGGRIAS